MSIPGTIAAEGKAQPRVLAIRAARTRLQEAHADEYAALVAEEMAERGYVGVPCRTCGALTFHGKQRGTGSATACPGECRAIFDAIKLHLPDYRGRHRPLIWKNDLKGNDPIKSRSAEKQFAGTAANHGRWFVRGSMAWQAASIAYSQNLPIFKELDEQLQEQIRGDVDAMNAAFEASR